MVQSNFWFCVLLYFYVVIPLNQPVHVFLSSKSVVSPTRTTQGSTPVLWFRGRTNLACTSRIDAWNVYLSHMSVAISCRSFVCLSAVPFLIRRYIKQRLILNPSYCLCLCVLTTQRINALGSQKVSAGVRSDVFIWMNAGSFRELKVPKLAESEASVYTPSIVVCRDCLDLGLFLLSLTVGAIFK